MFSPTRMGGGGASSFLGRPRTIPSCASHGGPFTLSRNPASCRRDGSNRRIVHENTRPPCVRTMCSSDKSCLPTQTTLDEHCVALVPTFSSLQTTMCRLWKPDKNDFRERHDFMSVMPSMGLFVRRHSVALRFVSTDLPSRMTQQPCPDRFVRAESFTAAKAHLVIRTDRPRLFLNSLDRTLSRIKC